MSCTFTTQPLAASSSDPTKHVNYANGMVLGVADFEQEFAYHAGHAHWLARDSVGYGVLTGLKVSWDQAASEIRVAPGTALVPSGRLVRVGALQCAKLEAWLEKPENAEAIRSRTTNAAEQLTLFVTLAYRACLSDDVPIPGEPCRSDDDLRAPSRVRDHYSLAFALDAPDQIEEDALGSYVDWLSRVPIVETGGSSQADFLSAIRTAAGSWLAEPSVVPEPRSFMSAAPPAGLAIPIASSSTHLRQALHLWITELRPKWRKDWLRGRGCDASPVEQRDIDVNEVPLLIGRVTLPIKVASGGQGFAMSDPSAVVCADAERPELLHLRFLQELALRGLWARHAAPKAVERVEQRYRVLAAGRISFNFTLADAELSNVKVESSYGELRATASGVAGLSIEFAHEAFSANSYVVKVTPWLPHASNRLKGALEFVVGETRQTGFDLLFAVSIPRMGNDCGVMVEVCDFDKGDT